MPGKSRARLAREAQLDEAARISGKATKGQYHAGFDKRAADYALLGATDEEIARLLEVSPASVSRWMIEQPTFRRAIQKSRVDANVRVVKAMHRAARGYTLAERKVKRDKRGQVIETIEQKRHVAPSVPAATLILTNRAAAHWADAKRVEHSGSVDLLALVQGALPAPGDGAKVIEAEPVEVAGPTSPSVEPET